MAKSSRKCDRCGGKASPWIPRARSGSGDQMLCAGCKQAERSERLASVMKVSEADPVPDRQPYGSATSGNGTDFGWDDDLAPEGYHPLMAPLPNSVWERYARRQELRGKRLVPMASQKAINARMRGENPGKTASLRMVAHEASGFDSMSPEDKAKHLQEHHGLPEHGAVSAVHSGYADTFHPEHHANPGNSSYDLTPHEHANTGGHQTLSHPTDLTPQTLHTHLTAHHGISPEHIENAVQATSPSVQKKAILNGLHDKAHSMGVGTEGHGHKGWDNGNFLHQTPHTSEEHVAHLKHAHGMTDEELAEYQGHPFGGAAHSLSHVHDDLHSSSHTGHEHTGHKDVGQPFTGITNSPHSGMDVHPHLMHSHGMSSGELNAQVSHLSPSASIGEQNAVWEKHHAEMHKQLGGALDHQHVPTVHEGVKTPEQSAKEAMHQHLKEMHGITPPPSSNGDFEHKSAHEQGSFDYKGHPGHEHGDADDPLKVTQQLPSEWKHQHGGEGDKVKSGHSFHYAHAEDMSPEQLKQHMTSHHTGGDLLDSFLNFDSHAATLQKHAQAHVTGKVLAPHSHEVSQGGSNEFGEKLYGGKEPEPSHSAHPAPESESDALAHIIKHHPNISAEDYHASKGSYGELSMQDFHEKLHSPKGGYASYPAPDGHTHTEPQGPATGIPIGSHLVSHHGLTQDQVAQMTPAEFKAHHEELHARHFEVDLGHGHLTPGGPVREPRTAATNPHHAEMRGDLDHPAVHEWYHGTSTQYSGPPKNATELQEDNGFWGNFGAGDWNNHAGTHWSSLHEMARNFNGGPNRVIHAKLHMSNPIKYNSLNHMSHDAYDRLHASGDMQDDGHYLGNHDDDNGAGAYNEHCCSNRLLEYAKGGHRSDGKFGMERYRDSLRASGHDGVVVRNQADSPKGHWNAIPLSADQIEITHASCHGHHDDERDNDGSEFLRNKSKLTSGWQHPKHFNPMDYTGGKPLPDKDEVDGAGTRKKAAPDPVHVREGRGDKRGDADPYLLGRDLGAGSSHEACEHCDSHDHDSEDCDGHWCEHCDEWGNHKSEDCTDKYCSVCDEHGSHTADEEHSYCNHCEDYADHDSDEHEDEWGEHPDKIRPEGYCPHCEESSKSNYGKSSCTNCGEKLPDWGKIASSGTPVKPGEYQEDGETDKYDYGPKKNAPKKAVDLGPGYETGLAAHLYHHHKSDVGGKEYEDEDGNFDHGKLHYHHQHLHADPAWAKGEGFEVDHTHPTLFPQYKSHESMTPAEIHAHMLLSHAATKDGGKDGTLPHAELLSMSSEEAVEHHKKLHAAQDAIPWGTKDDEGDLVYKVSHSHQLPDDHPSNAPAGHSPQGEELDEHLKTAHGMNVTHPKFKATFEQPGVKEAFHAHVHDSTGPAADSDHSKYHVHSPAANAGASTKQHLLDHLTEHHGIGAAHPMHDQYQQMTPGELTQAHDQEHSSMFPVGKDPEHTHSGKDPAAEEWTQHGKQASRSATLTDYFSEVGV